MITGLTEQPLEMLKQPPLNNTNNEVKSQTRHELMDAGDVFIQCGGVSFLFLLFLLSLFLPLLLTLEMSPFASLTVSVNTFLIFSLGCLPLLLPVGSLQELLSYSYFWYHSMIALTLNFLIQLILLPSLVLLPLQKVLELQRGWVPTGTPSQNSH